jgi:uncharacterized protein
VVNLFLKMKNRLFGILRNLLSQRASPHQIAVGFAVGVFVGIFPSFGLGALLILALSSVWKFNFPAALIGTVMGNPLFAPIWITLTCLVTGISPSEIKLPRENFQQILAHYSQIGLQYLLGNIGISLAAAIISYFIIIRAVHLFKKRSVKTSIN